MAGSFHLSEPSSIFLIHRVISGRNAASDLGWFAALSPGYTWRRWRRQRGTAAALAVTGMSVLQSYRHTQVRFKIPRLSHGCGLRGHSPVFGLAWYGVLAGHCGYPQYPRTVWLLSEPTRGGGPWL